MGGENQTLKPKTIQPLLTFEQGKINPFIILDLEGRNPNNIYYEGFLNMGPLKTAKEQQIAGILGQWISRDFYNELRTTKQMAYALGAGYSFFYGK